MPIPEDEDDEELFVDVHMVTTAGDGLPEGWVIVDGDVALDEVYLAQREAREKDMTLEQKLQMIEAKRAELQSYFSNHVWEFCDENDPLGRAVTARWVLTWKSSEDGGPPRAKARLVLRGFEDPDLLTIEKAAPTATRQSKLILLAMAGNNGWTVQSGDVKTAFLSGASFDRRIVVKLPNDCGPLLGGGREPMHMRMLKSAYGLADAPLLWWREADKRLRNGGWIRHPLDSCFYMHYDHGRSLLGCLVLHVDDVLIAGDLSNPDYKKAISNLRRSFNFGKWTTLTPDKPLIFCGGKISIENGDIVLSYHDYLKKVAPMTLDKDREMRKPLSSWELSKARGLIGALQWPAGQGFPALSASMSLLAADVTRADGILVQELNKALRFAKQNATCSLHFGKVYNRIDDCCIVAFADAAYAVRSDQSSQGGIIVILTSKEILAGKTVPYSVLSWRSSKLQRVCRSSLSAEAQSCSQAVDELAMIRTMIALTLDYTKDPRRDETAASCGKGVIVTDAKALFDSLRKPNFSSSQDKRTAIEVLCIQDEIRRQKLELRWVSSERMLADGLTKLAARQSFIDMFKTGIIGIIYDENFVAAKKKSPKERATSQQATTNMFGSKIAQQISTILALQSVDVTQAQGGRREGLQNNDLDYFTVFLMVVVTITIAAVIARLTWFMTSRSSSTMPPLSSSTATSSSTTRTSSATTTRTTGTQATEMGREEEIHFLNQMLQERNNHIDTIEHYNLELLEDARGYRNRIEGLQEQLRQALRQQPQGNGPIFLSSNGGRYHINRQCHHLQRRNVTQYQVCRDCARPVG